MARVFDYLTYVQLPSASALTVGGTFSGGDLGGVPVSPPSSYPIDPWHPVASSLVRGESLAPVLERRSYEIARSIYPLYPLKTELVTERQLPLGAYPGVPIGFEPVWDASTVGSPSPLIQDYPPIPDGMDTDFDLPLGFDEPVWDNTS